MNRRLIDGHQFTQALKNLQASPGSKIKKEKCSQHPACEFYTNAALYKHIQDHHPELWEPIGNRPATNAAAQKVPMQQVDASWADDSEADCPVVKVAEISPAADSDEVEYSVFFEEIKMSLHGAEYEQFLAFVKKINVIRLTQNISSVALNQLGTAIIDTIEQVFSGDPSKKTIFSLHAQIFGFVPLAKEIHEALQGICCSHQEDNKH